MSELRRWSTPDLVSAWTQYYDLVSAPAEGTPGWLMEANREKRDEFDAEIRRRKRAGTVPMSGLVSSVDFGLKDTIKASVDIVDLIGETVTLRRNGRTETGLCPYHDDRDPSLVVYPETQSWYCFGACQAGGDIFTWIEQRDSVNFVDAFKVAAARAGLDPGIKAKETPKDAATVAADTAPDEGWTKFLSDKILEQDHFAVDVGGRLYRYDAGAYRPDGERWIARRCKEILEGLDEARRWTTYRVGQVKEYIAVDRPRLWDRPPLGVLSVQNGLLDLTSGELSPHTPAHLSTVQIPVEYDPDADCPFWQRFIKGVFPADCQDLPWELVAWLMIPTTSIQKAVLLLGEGNNGKSTFLTALGSFLGHQNVAGVSLHKLEANRFATAQLVGKLANVCPDLPSAHLAGTSVFKALTGGDLIHAEWKHGAMFEFASFARLVFSANYPPQSSDSSHAFFRRWLVVPFERTFTDKDEISREELDRRLSDPKELSGVLNMALIHLQRIRDRGITTTESMQKAWYEFREVTDPVEVWLDLNTIHDPEVYAVKGDLLRAYNEDAKKDGRPVMMAGPFGKAVRRWKPGVYDGQKRLAGKRPEVWHGIGLKARETDN